MIGKYRNRWDNFESRQGEFKYWLFSRTTPADATRAVTHLVTTAPVLFLPLFTRIGNNRSFYCVLWRRSFPIRHMQVTFQGTRNGWTSNKKLFKCVVWYQFNRRSRVLSCLYILTIYKYLLHLYLYIIFYDCLMFISGINVKVIFVCWFLLFVRDNRGTDLSD